MTPVRIVPFQVVPGTVEHYLGAFAARVDVAGDSHEVFESSLPLRVQEPSGGWRPMDLGLTESAAGSVPGQTLAPTWISSRRGDGVSFEDSGFALVPLGSADAPDSQVVGGAAVCRTR